MRLDPLAEVDAPILMKSLLAYSCREVGWLKASMPRYKFVEYILAPLVRELAREAGLRVVN